MNTKRTPVALLIVSVMTTIVLPAVVAAQGGRASPVAPRREIVVAVIQEAYDKFKGDKNAKNADYIPYLAPGRSPVHSHLF